MNPELSKKRRDIHQQVTAKLAETVSTICAFVLVFASLMTISNWSAYSKVAQDILGFAEASHFSAAVEVDLSELKDPTEISHAAANDQLFQISDLGPLYPDEMRIAIPKLFGEETIPVKGVDIDQFNFADLYTSENKIQEALREGVVHYPFTADPDQYGNVFITGHSSYYPWDKGQYKDVFALLHKLVPNDEYFLFFKGKSYTYRVTSVFEVQPDDVSVLDQPTDQRLSTLMTCTPLGTTLRRLIVRAELVHVQ